MAKNKMLKMTAAVMSVAFLANTCFTGMFNASAETVPDTQAQPDTSIAYIDNSNLVPAYVTADKVNLELSDGGLVSWTPDWVKSLIMTELNISGASENGKFSGMEKALKQISSEGVNGIWLTPINNDILIDGDGNSIQTKGNRYSNFGPDTVSYSLTGTTDYEQGWNAVKQFVDLAHSYNIRVFLDVITWGLNEQAPIYTDGQHTNWFTTYKEPWNGYLFDWTNAKSTGLYDWFKNGMVNMITATGADGFRADCGSSYAGTELFRDVRQTLINSGHKIAMFSEHPETRDGTFEFEEHSYVNDTVNLYKTHTLYTENNIVDSVKAGAFTGNGKYYTSMVSCHDYPQYTSDNNLIQMGYASILSPFIPLWYFGEEWNNSETAGISQLYQNTMKYSEIDTNRDYYEKIKSYIAVRRTYSNIFENYAADSTAANIAKVNTSGTGLNQAYARYGSDGAVLVVPNNSTADLKLTVTVPDMGLDNTQTYRLIDALTGEVIINNCEIGAITSFNDSIAAGEIGVYAIEKVAKVNGLYVQEIASADTDNDPNPAYRVAIAFNKQIGIEQPGPSYWYRNLQQYMAASQNVVGNDYTLHNALAKTIRENLFINGISVSEAEELYGTIATHVIISGAGGNILELRILKENNPFGITGSKPFEIEFRGRISIGGYVLNPSHIYYSAIAANTYAVYSDTVKFSNPVYSDGKITLEADHNLECAADSVSAKIGTGIQINGQAVDASKVSVSGKKLTIEYAAQSDFDLYISGGIILNGYELSPTRYNVSVAGYSPSGFVKKDGEEVTNTDQDTGLTPYWVNLYKKDTVPCGQPDHQVGNQYVVEFVLRYGDASSAKDASILTQFPSSNGYWNDHLQVSAIQAMVNEHILINGKSINECIAEGSRSGYTAIHVRATSNALGPVLQLYIPENNEYGFNLDKEFTVEFTKGFSLNNLEINSRRFDCPGYTDTVKSFGSAYLKTTTSWIDSMISADNATAGDVTFYENVRYSNVCNSHSDKGTDWDHWLVEIKMDKDINDMSMASYYRTHLQQPLNTGSTITSPAADFQSKVLLNGKTLAQCLQNEVDAGGITDPARFMHLMMYKDASGNSYLRIAIPKDNKYGFNGSSDFAVEFKSGLMLNGITLNPFKLSYTAPTAPSVEFKTPTVTINSGTKVEASGNYCNFKLMDTVNKPNLTVGGYTITNGLMQSIVLTSSDVMREAAVALCSNIKINGDTIGEGNVLAKHYASAMCATGNDYAFKFQFDLNNVYGVSTTERLTLEITDKIIIDGYIINPVVYAYNGNGTGTTSTGYWPEVVPYQNGTISPRNPSNGAWITSKQNQLAEGDTIRVKVQPNDGYQLKAGSLTYTYWYKGELKIKQVSELAKTEGTISYFDIKSPGAVGVLDAEFVPVGENANMATLGASPRTVNPQGLRFVSRLFIDNIDVNAKTITVNGEVCQIKDIHTEIGIADEYDDVNWDKAYIAKADLSAANDKFIDLTAEIVNISQNLYDVNFAARAVLSYVDTSGATQTVYSEIVNRTVNNVIN